MNRDQPTDTALLPRDPSTGDPLPPSAQPGYYPGFSTLAQKSFWDEATRNLILLRVEQPPPIRFFTADQAKFWRSVFDHLIPQHDRTPDRRIAILEPIDDRLYRNKTAGFRYENMPPDREAYQLGQSAIDQEAEKRFAAGFLLLPHRQQDLVLWQLLLQDAIESYYSHPWAWDEIGFGGPAYPRAYTRLERGEPEPWEVEEQRYQWQHPDYAVSDVTESTHHLHLENDQNG
jgi:hypothetical protein